MRFTINNMVISGYDGINDALMFVHNAYSRCYFNDKNDLPPDIFELEDNFVDEILDSGIQVFYFSGVPIGKRQLIDMLEMILLKYRIEYVDSLGRHLNDSQNIMFEEMMQ